MGVEKSPVLIPIGPLRSCGTEERTREPIAASRTLVGSRASLGGEATGSDASASLSPGVRDEPSRDFATR